jgi:hypothetical protein
VRPMARTISGSHPDRVTGERRKLNGAPDRRALSGEKRMGTRYRVRFTSLIVEVSLTVLAVVSIPTISGCSGSGSRPGHAVDATSNPCVRACVERLTSHPDLLAPQCKDVTPLSAYQDCVKTAAGHVADICLDECKVPHK